MTRKVLIPLGLAVALGLTPTAALSHQGHDHGVKAKKLKKSKSKKAAIDFIVPRPMGVTAQKARTCPRKSTQLSGMA